MKKWLIAIGIVIISAVAGAMIYHQVSGDVAGAGTEVDWRMLGKLDYVSGKAPADVQALNGTDVKIPGFMVPLEDEQKAVTQFLLVPSPQACIHVPAPPPNQMVYVKMKKGTAVAFGPIWVHGKLNLSTQKSMYGEASYELVGESVEPYR